MTISPLMREFLQSWLDWVENGAPEWAPYSREEGLCHNAYVFLHRAKRLTEWNVLDTEFRTLFRNRVFPFGARNYFMHQGRATQHSDPLRLAFVRKFLSEN
jgi:hypothetical protein